MSPGSPPCTTPSLGCPLVSFSPHHPIPCLGPTHSPRKDCHHVLWIRGVLLREVWWFAQGHTVDSLGQEAGHIIITPASELFPDPPGLHAAIPAVPRQRAQGLGGPVSLSTFPSSRPSPDSQRKTSKDRISTAGAWREASSWLQTVPPPDPGSAPGGPSDLGSARPEPAGGGQAESRGSLLPGPRPPGLPTLLSGPASAKQGADSWRREVTSAGKETFCGPAAERPFECPAAEVDLFCDLVGFFGFGFFLLSLSFSLIKTATSHSPTYLPSHRCAPFQA